MELYKVNQLLKRTNGTYKDGVFQKKKPDVLLQYHEWRSCLKRNFNREIVDLTKTRGDSVNSNYNSFDSNIKDYKEVRENS